MKRLHLVPIALIIFAYACQEKVEQQVYFNPILPDYVADPSLALFNDTFYLYGTTDIDHGLDKMGIPVVWKSVNFVDWWFDGELETGIDWNIPHRFTDDKGKERNGYFRYWAPGKTQYRNGMYYLFPTIVTPDTKMGTFVMLSEKPEGPYRFRDGKTIRFNRDSTYTDNAQPLIGDIDGEPFIDDNGDALIYWRRRFASKMTSDFSALEGETVSISTTFGGYSEGPIVFKRDSIYYYLYTLSGHANYCNGYMMSTTSALGPFEAPANENIFVHSDLEQQIWGPGHGNVFQMPGTDDFYFLYLEYGEGGTTRQVFVNKMEFNSDGTIQPMQLSKEGVGSVTNLSLKKNLASTATATASSFTKQKTTATNIIANPNALKSLRVNHRDGKKVERTFTYTPNNALDQNNGTIWKAEVSDPEKWFQIDLGKTKRIETVEMYFLHPTFGHAWKLEKSNNGTNWETCAVQERIAIKSPHIASNIQKARYLRLTITDGPAGLFEFKVY